MTLVLSTAATAATYSVVTSFGISKGYYARGDVVELADGSLVGTAVYGGASNRGTVFKIDSAGEASILHSFKGADGSSPYGGLIRGSDGLLYGTTAGGGANDLGVLFKITTTGTYTLLHSFAGYDPVTATYPEGTNPYGGLVEGPDGNFYGLTRFGGTEDGGTIFRVSPGGTFAIARSLAFDDGGESTAALVRGSDDLLYGVTPAGGTTGLGTIFSYATGTGAFTILHTFSAADGYGTFGRLAEGADGKLYGATSGGGANDNGTVFSIERDGSFFSVEYSLAGFNSGLGYAPDGSRIAAGLTKGTDNSLYGVASAGGSASGGTFFKFTPGAGFTMLHPFTSAEGKHPFAGLIEGADGRFYGATTEDGTNGNGALFALSTSGSYAEAYAFDHTPAMPIGGVIKGIDGNFYGTTYAGGFGAGFGTVFKVTPDGTLTVLHRFNVTDGAQPEGTLVQAADGTLYGTTTTGGTKRLGTIFKIPTGGALTTLHAFAPFDPTLGAYPDGYSPVAGLTLSGGVLYGTATFGGLYDAGTLYQITTDGTFSVAHHFCDGDPLHDACADGADPVAGLIEGTDGALYGTTTGGGANYLGVIFKLAGGTVNVLYSFAPFDDALGYFPDGYNPLGSLTEGGDGSFYGTMANGGPLGRGVVFRFNPATSAFAVLHAFSNGADGGGPLAGMIEASDGNLYGTTSTGGPGAGAAGTVFRLAPDAVLETVFAFNTASAPLNGHTPQA
ncbi:MAG: hypothetical protein HYX76_03925, partial [Acidobacteria bacterium]|nr:hypothetical protein [Acidobacteriota bacterium]